MGPSGSGKSTLLNLIAGMDRPTSGTVRVGDEQVDKLSETAVARFRRRQVGMIFQFFNLLDDMTVLDNVLLPAQLAGARAQRPRDSAPRSCWSRCGSRTGATPTRPRLSGGERQRVAIARALVNRPAVLLADEPTGAVDSATGDEIGALLLELNAAGQTLILVTHNPELAARYAHRVVELADGRIALDTATMRRGSSDDRRDPRGPRRPGRAPTAGGDHRPGGAGRHRRLDARRRHARRRAQPLRPRVRGAARRDVTATVDTSAATPAQLAATTRLPGVTAAAGPFATVSVTAQIDSARRPGSQSGTTADRRPVLPRRPGGRPHPGQRPLAAETTGRSWCLGTVLATSGRRSRSARRS